MVDLRFSDLKQSHAQSPFGQTRIRARRASVAEQVDRTHGERTGTGTQPEKKKHDERLHLPERETLGHVLPRMA